MTPIESLFKYKSPYYFKRFETYEDFVNHQLALYVNDKDLTELRDLCNLNSLSLDYAIMRIKVCNINSLDFYARYLLYETKDEHYKTKIEGIKALVDRFTKEDDKLQIYNILRPLVNFLDLKDALGLLDCDSLSILLGEFARKNNFKFDQLGNSNLCQKFLGFYAAEYFKEIENLDELVGKDKNILKVVTHFDKEHFYLKKILEEDENIQFYLIECNPNLEWLKTLPLGLNPYSLYLLFSLAGEDEDFVNRDLSLMDEENLFFIFSLALKNKNWLKKHLKCLRNTKLSSLFYKTVETKDPQKVLQEIDTLEFLKLSVPLELNKPESEVALKFCNLPKDQNFMFMHLEKLESFILHKTDNNLKEIDELLFENYALLKLKAYLDSIESITISNWLGVKEVYFNEVVKKSFLKDFHFSFFMNNKKRKEMANELLKGKQSETFLRYLNERGIYVDLEGVEFKFSIQWLKLLLGEHHKSLKITFWEKETEEIKIAKEKELKINKSKFELLRGEEKEVKKDLEEASRKKIKIEEVPIEISQEEILFNRILKNSCLVEEIAGFTKFGLLNKFISSHLEDLEGCARVACSVVLAPDQFKTFLRTLEFVIENQKSLKDFVFHFLRFCRFEIDLFSVTPFLDLSDQTILILLSCKAKVSGLDYLIQNCDYQNISNGFLLRSYSYHPLPPTKGKFKKIKDGELIFYYSLQDFLEFKYQSLTFRIYYKNSKAFYSYLEAFKTSSCPIRKTLLQRVYKVVKDKIGEVDFNDPIKEDPLPSPPVEEKNIIDAFLKDPKENLIGLSLLEGPFDKPVLLEALNLLKTLRGEEESLVYQILKGSTLDQDLIFYTLSHFDLFSFSSKIFLLDSFNSPINQNLFLKLCEVVANEDNLKILKILLNKLKESGTSFEIIEKWKSNPKLTKLLVRIYPLSYRDKDFYARILENYKDEEEKKMLKDFYFPQ